MDKEWGQRMVKTTVDMKLVNKMTEDIMTALDKADLGIRDITMTVEDKTGRQAQFSIFDMIRNGVQG